MPADMGFGQEFRHELPQTHIPGATDHGMPSVSQLYKTSIEGTSSFSIFPGSKG
jgi:hypothetical protein